MGIKDVKPTRSELIKLKQRIKLAKSGHSLLKKKRDGLIIEFFEILKEAKTISQELSELYGQALEKINVARATEGDVAIRSLAMAVKERPSIELESQNIMGVVVPKIEHGQIERDAFENRGYGELSASTAIMEATQAFEKVVEKIIKAAEVETSMKKLLIEIEKTKRRVNALEFSVIPQLDEVKRFVTLRLEEMERENTFRMKKIKSK